MKTNYSMAFTFARSAPPSVAEEPVYELRPRSAVMEKALAQMNGQPQFRMDYAIAAFRQANKDRKKSG